MDSPLKAPNGNAPAQVTLVKDVRRGGLMTSVASWLVNVAIPTLMTDPDGHSR